MVLSQSAKANLDSNSVLFQIEFNRAPDFFTTDEYDRQADFFQYYINADGGLPVYRDYSDLESIIGGEIAVGGNVGIRNAWPPDPDWSSSGGWGSIRGSVPYTLSGNVLSLLIPLQVIGDSDGKFSYVLQWGEYGGQQGWIETEAEAEAVPEPATIFGSFMALGGLAAFHRKNKQLKGLRSRSQ
ncbi:MAG TPA: PEP-CTERM sorting domain-containing protein [Candidatus Sericytochromatia bacterium]